MSRFTASLVLCSLLLITISPLAAQSLGGAAVHGTVRDDSGEAIPGVTVTAGEEVAVTGMDGAFRFDSLRPGAVTLQAVLEGFQPVSKEVKLTPGQDLAIAFKLVPAFSASVEVVATAEKTGEVAILENRRQAPVVSDSISAEEIRRTPDSSAAGVVERLTGVTLLGDKYVFVRGLGERYSGTTINGSALPTTETEKRVVPLDLFPAKLLESVNVLKTWTPDKPGDFGSGVVEMTTTQFPDAASFKVTVGAGYQSGTTGGDFLRYAGGLDRLGDGGQPISSAIPPDFLQRSSILNPRGFTPQELEAFGEAMAGDWTGRATSSASPSTDFAVTYGNSFGRLGVVLSLASNHGFDTVNEEQRFFGVDAGNVLVPVNDYDLVSNRETATTGLVGNFSLRLSDTNRLFLNSVLTRDASSEDRFQEGLQTNIGGEIRDFRVRYQLEEVFSTRLRGEHNLSGPGLGSLVEWSLARSSATNDSDLRENVYREGDDGVFELQTGAAESGKIEYFGLEDQIEQGGLAYSVFFNAARLSGTVKTGFDRFDRTRDFAARRFRFSGSPQLQADLTLTPDEIFTSANIGPNGFEVREVTGVNDAYDAEHVIDAGYLMADATFGRWRVITGARYESSEQRVTTFDPFDIDNALVSINENTDVLPSVNVVWQMAAQTNLRFGYARSLNRPEFRELSPFTFIEVAGGRSVAGNPNLEQATLDGYDLRWESFPRSGEVVAASLFYKKIDSPIERIIQPTSDLRTSFVNAESATLKGIELEFRRSLDAFFPALHRWSINLNLAHIRSDVTIGEQQLSVVTSTSRPLEGQSDNVANLAFQFYHPQWGTMFRVLGSYSGERLTEAGAFGLPDIYEDSFTSLDFVLSQSLGPWAKGLEVKLAGTNLLDEKRTFTQGGEIQRRFDPGRKVSVSISYSPY